MVKVIDQFLLFATLSISITNSAMIPRPRITRTVKGPLWTPWSRCPTESFVSNLHIQYASQPDVFGHRPLIGLQFTCSNRNDYSIGAALIPVFNGNNTAEQSLKQSQTCRTKEFHGLLNGLQLRKGLVVQGESIVQRSVLNVNIYCDDTIEMRKRQFIDRNFAVDNSHWDEPFLCGWGEFVCAGRVLVDPVTNQIINIEAECCTEFTVGIGWRSYREAYGRVLFSPIPANLAIGQYPAKQQEIDEYFDLTFDHPYYQKWQFCPISTFVVGMHLQNPIRRLQLLCSDMSRPAPRSSSQIQMPEKELPQIWENYDDISKAVKCDGVAIGLQVKYHLTDGIQGIRLICSFSEVEGQLSFIEGRFPTSPELAEEGIWEESVMCGNNQAVCGFKSLSTNPQFQPTNSTLYHLKLKCCNIPNIAEICFPQDKYELVVECDATQAWAPTTCQYTQTEGISLSSTRTLGERREEHLRKVLSEEWTISDGIQNRESSSLGKTESISVNEGITLSNGSSQGFSSSQLDSRGGSGTINFGNSTGNSRGFIKGVTNSSSRGDTLEAGRSTGSSNSAGQVIGETSGSSRSGVNSVSSSKGISGSISSSKSSSDSNTAGVSTGTMNAVTKANSTSKSQASTASSSKSKSRSQTNSASRSRSGTFGMSMSVGVTTEAGGNVGFVSGSLKTNFEMGVHASATLGSEDSQSNQHGQSSESSNSQSNTVSSDTSVQENVQSSRDISSSNSRMTGVEDTKSNTNSEGLEKTNSSTIGSHSEVNSQKNTNSHTEQGRTRLNRTNLEIGVQQNAQDTVEINHSANLQLINETNTNSQNSNGNESSITINQSLNRERQNQNSVQQSNERSLERISTKGRQVGGSSDNGLTTGYDWSQSSGRTWSLEKSYQITMTVPAGVRTQLFQIVGNCAFYQVRTSKFKRVDYAEDWFREGQENENNLE